MRERRETQNCEFINIFTFNRQNLSDIYVVSHMPGDMNVKALTPYPFHFYFLFFYYDSSILFVLFFLPPYFPFFFSVLMALSPFSLVTTIPISTPYHCHCHCQSYNEGDTFPCFPTHKFMYHTISLYLNTQNANLQLTLLSSNFDPHRGDIHVFF